MKALIRHTFVISLICGLVSCKTSKADLVTPKRYEISEKDFVPEGIAYSELKDAFYLTSVSKAKIMEIDRTSGSQSDFISDFEYNYSPGAGIYVDDSRNQLHALGGYYLISDSLSALYTFDINSKVLLERYSVNDGRKHFLNDMVMDKKGNMYITDSKDSSVFVLKEGSDELSLYHRSSEIVFPNGIALSDDQSKLYVASFAKGVRVFDLNTKQILNGVDSLDISTGIDGLEFYKGSLFAVQNGVGTNSFNFRELILSEGGDSIVDTRIIDSHNPELDVPLTFCIAHNKAILIGNSNLQFLDQKTLQFADSDSIKNTTLLVYDID